jgi:hypothetical protein
MIVLLIRNGNCLIKMCRCLFTHSGNTMIDLYLNSWMWAVPTKAFRYANSCKILHSTTGIRLLGSMRK